MQLLLFTLSLSFFYDTNCETTEATPEYLWYPYYYYWGDFEIDELPHVPVTEQVTYDGLLKQMKDLKQDLLSVLPNISDDENPPPKGSQVVLNNGTNRVEILTQVRFKQLE